MQFNGGCEEETVGAMSDASKRRFHEDEVDVDAEFEEFAVIQAIEHVNAPSSAGLGPIASGQMDALPLNSTAYKWLQKLWWNL